MFRAVYRERTLHILQRVKRKLPNCSEVLVCAAENFSLGGQRPEMAGPRWECTRTFEQAPRPLSPIRAGDGFCDRGKERPKVPPRPGHEKQLQRRPRRAHGQPRSCRGVFVLDQAPADCIEACGIGVPMNNTFAESACLAVSSVSPAELNQVFCHALLPGPKGVTCGGPSGPARNFRHVALDQPVARP